MKIQENKNWFKFSRFDNSYTVNISQTCGPVAQWLSLVAV